MQELIQTLKNLPLMLTSKPATVEQIIHVQQDLKINKIAKIPQDFTELLHQLNTLEYDGTYLLGINPRSYYLDIFAENEMLNLPNKENLLILGYDEFEYLAYNQTTQCYQIIDKDTLEVLQTFSDLVKAIKYLFKIDNDEEYF